MDSRIDMDSRIRDGRLSIHTLTISACIGGNGIAWVRQWEQVEPGDVDGPPAPLPPDFNPEAKIPKLKRTLTIKEAASLFTRNELTIFGDGVEFLYHAIEGEVVPKIRFKRDQDVSLSLPPRLADKYGLDEYTTGVVADDDKASVMVYAKKSVHVRWPRHLVRPL